MSEDLDVLVRHALVRQGEAIVLAFEVLHEGAYGRLALGGEQ